MRELPTMPAIIKIAQNHHSGLKANNMEKASSAPAKPPIAAVWVEIFHHTFIMAHTIWMTSAATRMFDIN